MAHITLNTTTTSPASLALPDNARIVIIDADTNAETADLVISGAESLIVSDDDVQITTTATAVTTAAAAGNAEKVVVEDDGAENHSAEDTDTENTETSEAPNTLTVSHNADIAQPRYSFCLIYNKATGIYTDSTTGTEVATDTVIDIIGRAHDNAWSLDNATASMTFDIPGHGVTTFVGDLFENYNGHAGLTLVGVDGGAYVLDAERELTDDMTVLNQACFIFAEDPEVFFDGLDVNIAYDIVEVNNIRTYDADAKLYTEISSRSHDLKRYAIRRIVNYAATHDLSARLQLMAMDEEVYQPYVGRLQPVTNDPENTKFLFVDKKLGKLQFNLDKVDHDFVLEVYSDADMRRRGFAGTNHADYAEISVNEMASHLITTLDV